MKPGDAHESVLWAVLGICPVMVLTSAEAASLTSMDNVLLREMGTTDAMLAQLQALGAEPGLLLHVDVAEGEVRVVEPDSP